MSNTFNIYKGVPNPMQLKAKENFTWQMFFVGVILGVFLLPLLRWLFSWLIRLQPHIALVKWFKSLSNKKFKKF